MSFTANTCPRCGVNLLGSMMSRFNTEEICFACIDREKKHPKYQEAFDTELAAVKRGNFNFPGIGAPPDLYLTTKPCDLGGTSP